MRNQTSFRLTSTLLPTDTTATTTTVINKVDSNGDKFYPTFTEETVVLTNDDRTVMETTRAICTDGALTFTKRGLSDDNSETQVPNRKLTWNPGTLAFITAGAGDWIDKDDNITWSGNQTYTGNLTSTGNATYNGLLTTNKGVKYPSFANLAALEAYASPFAGMFAVLDSDGELYRYNAVTETWSVVTTNEPTNPEMADDETIGTVRVATDAEFAAGTEQGSNNEYLMPTVGQVKANTPSNALHFTELDIRSNSCTTAGTNDTVTYTVPHDGFLVVVWTEYVSTASKADGASCNRMQISGTADPELVSSNSLVPSASTGFTAPFAMIRRNLYAVKAGTISAKILCDYAINSSDVNKVNIESFFYFS